jgi:hypothetical protein
MPVQQLIPMLHSNASGISTMFRELMTCLAPCGVPFSRIVAAMNQLTCVKELGRKIGAIHQYSASSTLDDATRGRNSTNLHICCLTASLHTSVENVVSLYVFLRDDHV